MKRKFRKNDLVAIRLESGWKQAFVDQYATQSNTVKCYWKENGYRQELVLQEDDVLLLEYKVAS